MSNTVKHTAAAEFTSQPSFSLARTPGPSQYEVDETRACRATVVKYRDCCTECGALLVFKNGNTQVQLIECTLFQDKQESGEALPGIYAADTQRQEGSSIPKNREEPTKQKPVQHIETAPRSALAV